MKIIQKFLDFRAYLATVDDYVPATEATKYPKIHIFMFADTILLLATAISSALALACHVLSLSRFPGICDNVYTVTMVVLGVGIDACLSTIGSFRNWRPQKWLILIGLYLSIVIMLSILVKTSLGNTLPTLFLLPIGPWKIEVDPTLLAMHGFCVLWCINSIFMYRYKIHLHRRLFVSNSNIPLWR